MYNKIPVSCVADTLLSAYQCRSEIVPCLIGAPGIGKTQGIEELAEKLNVKLVTFILSNTIPSEVSGIRMPDNETKKLEVFDDSRMASLRDGDILFFDELLEAPRELWSACLTLIQSRIMASGRPLPDVFIVAASNPLASPMAIPASVRDRFQFLDVEFDSESWATWFEAKYGKRPGSSILCNISDNSSDYNIFTPRRVEKLCKWYCMAEDKDVVYKAIQAMFGTGIAKAIKDLCEVGRNFRDALFEELDDIGVVLGNNIDEIPMAKVLAKLQALDNWPEIEARLASMEYSDEVKYIM